MTQDLRAAPVSAETEPGPHPLRWLWLAGAAVGILAAGAAGTALSPAVPALANDLGLSSSEVRWALGLMALGFAVLVLPAAMLGDWFGHARLFLLGAVGFTVASGLGAVATGEATLLVARLAQGLTAAVMVPQMIGYARRYLPRAERAVACGLFGLAFVAGPVLGPALGVALVTRAGWQGVFWVVVPAGALAAASAVPLVWQRVDLRADPLALGVAAAALPATGAIMLVLTARTGSTWYLWHLLLLFVGGLSLVTCLTLETVRRGAWTGFGAPVVALLASAGAVHLAALQVYAQLAGGFSATSVAVAGLPGAGGAVVGAGIAAGLAIVGLRRITAAVGAAVIGAGAGVSLVLLGGEPGTVTGVIIAIDAGLTGVGLAMVVVAALHGGRAGGRAWWSAPAVVFPALALGTAAGGVLLERLPADAPLPGQPLDALHDATRSVLVWSLGLLAAAALVAAVMTVIRPVDREGTDAPTRRS